MKNPARVIAPVAVPPPKSHDPDLSQRCASPTPIPEKEPNAIKEGCLLRNLAHLGLDPQQVVFNEPMLRIEVVIESILHRRPER